MFQSLRLRLVIMFVLIFGAVQLTLSTVGLIAREQHLRRYFDHELMRRSQSMAASLVASRKRFFPGTLSRIIAEESKSIYFLDFYVQARDLEGNILGHSDNLGSFRLPCDIDGLPLRAADGAKFETISGKKVELLAGPDESLRMATLRVNTDDDEKPFYLQVASSLRHVDESVATVRLIFLLGIPLGLLAAGVASSYVAGQAVRRIDQVADVVRQVTPQQLGSRIEVENADDEVGQMAERINAMLSRLEAGFKAQRQFIDDASHELKTPLSTLISEAQVLMMTAPTTDEYHQFAAGVEEEMRYLSRLVESLLMLTRHDGRTTLPRLDVVSINDAVVTALRECEPLAQQHGVQLELTLHMPRDDDPDPDLHCLGNSELLSALVANLIRNAVRFSPPDQPVRITVERNGREALIRVRDHGPGIPESLLEHIFDRFAQAPEEKQARRGTGLGLTIAHTIAQLHKGTLQVRNLPDGGCAFAAMIPLVNLA